MKQCYFLLCSLTAIAVQAGAIGCEDAQRESLPVASSQRLDLNDPTLVAYWNFNEGSGTTLIDRTGDGNDGTVQDATWDPNGREGGCLYFNGTTSMVVVPDGPDRTWNQGTPKTFNLWYRTDGEDNTRWVLSHLYSGTGSGSFALDDLKFRTYGSSTPRNASAPNPVTWRPWTMATAVVTETELRLYRDGELVAATALTGGLPIRTGPLHFGARGSSSSGRFRGWIDEAAFYSRALTGTEIAALYQENAESSDLVGEWSFDEMEGSTAFDSSGHAEPSPQITPKISRNTAWC